MQQDRPVVMQAVHHSCYPLDTLPAWPAGQRESRLVLIAAGALPVGLQHQFGRCAA